MKVKIDQKHIDFGIPGDCQNCPLAAAIREAAPGLGHIRVAQDRIPYVEYEVTGKPYRRMLSTEAINFVTAFDTTHKACPTEIELGPEEAIVCLCDDDTAYRNCPMHRDRGEM